MVSNQIRDRRPPETAGGSYSFYVADRGTDAAWDSFLSECDSGHHVQSSIWSQVKTYNGWNTKRITVLDGARILGGAQMLIRKTRYVGNVGYVPKGPVSAGDNKTLVDELLQRILEIAKSEKIKVLLMQPPEFGVCVQRLTERGFGPSPVETAPSATILVDLSNDLDTILARMTKSMRNGVRRSQRRGITVRAGTKDDLPTFHKLLSMTSQRRGFSIFDLGYFHCMWNIMEPSGGLKLFLSEYDGEPVSAQICVPFGDRIVAKQIGWSGKHRKLHPNEALDWNTIQWAKENGYRYYDLEGIERPAASAIIGGQPLPLEYADSPTAYKLRLGGEVRLDPMAYCLISNSVMRLLYNHLGFRLASWSLIQKAVSAFRTG